ncbi:hypothetical protein [Streptomyces antimicrobicus]|uniref:Uncharacterized protein n=1 Tax=Streptomyces antimicrobicus TaxID=2883108 RepID=A0ABS8B8F8_9ACTN|nr:hypothetical protein [Streptomyces antimicrobicus]MCB5180900.1 hypothetical protein [Streptomyces antimicrobicus]
MTHCTVRRATAGAALAVVLALVCAPASQAAPAHHGTGTTAGPLSLDNILSLRFLTPTVRDAKRQVGGLVFGMSPAPRDATALGGLLR